MNHDTCVARTTACRHLALQHTPILNSASKNRTRDLVLGLQSCDDRARAWSAGLARSLGGTAWLAELEDRAVGLSWQQGPLSPGAIGRFLVAEPLPKRLLYLEPLRRRMRVRFGGHWIADSERALVLFEPGRYPVAYFPEGDISPEALQRTEHTTQHPDLGLTSWYSVRAGEHSAGRAAWQHVQLPAHARELQTRVAFAWHAMEAFYEEEERILGHAADSYHRIDIRQPYI